MFRGMRRKFRRTRVGRRLVSVYTASCGVGVATGGVRVHILETSFQTPGVRWRRPERTRTRFAWSFEWKRTPGLGAACIVPLWWFCGAALLSTKALWWLDRRANQDGCCKCGYSRAGLAVGARCPECGTSGART
jgi:hypothetical protein